jgi:hypothetical protein
MRPCFLILIIVVCGCGAKPLETPSSDYWWIQHMGELSPNGYTPSGSFPPWNVGLSQSQRQTLMNADAAVFLKLREVLPSGENDFHTYAVDGWKRISLKDEVDRFVQPLLKHIDKSAHTYPEDCLATVGVRVWQSHKAVDLVISISERCVHVLDDKEHRFCEIPKNEIGIVAQLLREIQWVEKRKQ